MLRISIEVLQGAVIFFPSLTASNISFEAAGKNAIEIFSALVEYPFLVFLIFLQSLHRAYHTNYFIDLFRWFSSVCVFHLSSA